MFTLPPLPYSYEALEPVIDVTTMQIHHDKHHQAYIDNLNTALANHADLSEMSISELLTSCKTLPEEIQTAVKNNGGGHANHSLYWEILSPTKTDLTTGPLHDAICAKWNSVEVVQEQLSQMALKQFGSGWGWLVLTDTKELEIYTTPNQDSPYMSGHTPILGIDVWEHAYYLNYQNKRADYLKAIWNIVNWPKVEELYTKTLA